MTVPLPSFTDGIDLRYFIEPLNGPKGVHSYLDRFPDTLYNKSPNSRFLRFMYVLLGPAGIGWLRLDFLYARLQLEAAGLQLFDLESFYGDPFSFGRILTDSYDDDITGLLPAAVWDRIRRQDEFYRSRALLFMNALRFGSSPLGMELAASSGIGQNAEIIENYKYLFDNHSNDPLGLLRFGQTAALEEFTVRPRPAVSRSEVQTILFSESPVLLGANPFTLSYNGFSTPPLAYNADGTAVQSALEALSNGPVPIIGLGNVRVTGGPVPNDLTITFQHALSNQDVPTIVAQFNAPGYSDPIQIPVSVVTDGVNPSVEVAAVAAIDQHHMQVALDYLRPVNTFLTFINGRSHLHRQDPLTITSSSSLTRVIRYVTGNAGVAWPPLDPTHWIEASQERESQRLNDARQQHYVNFHNLAAVTAYSDLALADPDYATSTTVLSKYPSLHVGGFGVQATLLPFLGVYEGDETTVFSPEKAQPEYPEFLAVTQQTSDGTAFINGIYPADYLNLQGTPSLRYSVDHFWASLARPSGAEILEIDLGHAQAVNFITFEITRKPLRISVDYDLLDRAPARHFTPVTWTDIRLSDGQLFYDLNEQNPWEEVTIPCSDALGELLFTRFIRLTFTRRVSSADTAFLYDPSTQIQTPWTIEVRNLRIGRNVVPT